MSYVSSTICSPQLPANPKDPFAAHPHAKLVREKETASTYCFYCPLCGGEQIVNKPRELVESEGRRVLVYG